MDNMHFDSNRLCKDEEKLCLNMPLIFCNAKRRYVGNMSCYVYITANNKIGF